MNTALLSTTYFGPVQWYQKLYRYPRVLIEQHEPFLKQTYRNRCVIATAQGPQSLTVPVVHGPVGNGERVEVCSLRVSDHGNWQRQHWHALQAAYGDTPFFEYYADDLYPFFGDSHPDLLLDFNEAVCIKICELIDIHPFLDRTTVFRPPQALDGNLQATNLADFRDVIRPKNPLADPSFEPCPYYQVFASKTGFLPNMSILDLLFNMGPESIFFL